LSLTVVRNAFFSDVLHLAAGEPDDLFAALFRFSLGRLAARREADGAETRQAHAEALAISLEPKIA
jgi:hypothetical protein